MGLSFRNAKVLWVLKGQEEGRLTGGAQWSHSMQMLGRASDSRWRSRKMASSVAA